MLKDKLTNLSRYSRLDNTLQLTVSRNLVYTYVSWQACLRGCIVLRARLQAKTLQWIASYKCYKSPTRSVLPDFWWVNFRFDKLSTSSGLNQLIQFTTKFPSAPMSSCFTHFKQVGNNAQIYRVIYAYRMNRLAKQDVSELHTTCSSTLQ